jgi:hypothetical protein
LPVGQETAVARFVDSGPGRDFHRKIRWKHHVSSAERPANEHVM